jgi:hypothetical protein
MSRQAGVPTGPHAPTDHGRSVERAVMGAVYNLVNPLAASACKLLPAGESLFGTKKNNPARHSQGEE